MNTPHTPDAADRLAVAGQILADVALHIGNARAMLVDVADSDALHGIADLLAVAGWLSDFGASMAGEPGWSGDPLQWLMSPTTRAAVQALRTTTHTPNTTQTGA